MTLRKWLRNSKTSQSELARRVGVSPASIARYAAGLRCPRPQIMDAIARATADQVTPRDLVDAWVRAHAQPRMRAA
jgi:DNA-binding transcriptional regulator YdaS (Cro superfamily)